MARECFAGGLKCGMKRRSGKALGVHKEVCVSDLSWELRPPRLE